MAERPDLGEAELNDSGEFDRDVEVFMQLYAEHQRRIAIFLSGLLPSQADVDDCLQETSMTLWREFHKFEPGTNFRAWAYTIAFNRVRAWRTRQSRDRLVFSDEFVQAMASELTENPQYEARLKAMEECLKKLPEHHRELIDHRYMGEESIEKISEQLGRTNDAVYRMLSRIRHSLHECIDNTIKTEST